MKGPMFRIHPRQNGFDLSITGHFLEVHMSEDDETCLYCRCDVTRGQGVNAMYSVLGNIRVYSHFAPVYISASNGMGTMSTL